MNSQYFFSSIFGDRSQEIFTHKTIPFYTGDTRDDVPQVIWITNPDYNFLYDDYSMYAEISDGKLASYYNGRVQIYSKNEFDAFVLDYEVGIDLTPPNYRPFSISIDDLLEVEAEEPFLLNTFANFGDPDGDTLTFSVDGPEWVSINPLTGYITGLPKQSDEGLNTITVTATDPNGLSSSQTFTIDFVLDSITTAEDVTSSNIVVLEPLSSEVLIYANATNGTVVINADDTLTYTGNHNFHGDDIINYSFYDDLGATIVAKIYVTVTPVNDAPDSTTLADHSINEGSFLNLDVSSNFSDIDGDTLTYSISASDWASIDSSTGVISGVPYNDDVGVNTITVTATDPDGLTTSQLININVDNINNNPVAADDWYSTRVNSIIEMNVLDNDTDADGDALTITYADADVGTITINSDGTITYTSKEGFVGMDNVVYLISDGMGGFDDAISSILVGVLPDITPILPVADVATIEEDSANNSIDVLSNDASLESIHALSVVDDATLSANNGTVSVNTDGTINYTPNLNFNGTDTIVYTVTDAKFDQDLLPIYFDIHMSGFWVHQKTGFDSGIEIEEGVTELVVDGTTWIKKEWATVNTNGSATDYVEITNNEGYHTLEIAKVNNYYSLAKAADIEAIYDEIDWTIFENNIDETAFSGEWGEFVRTVSNNVDEYKGTMVTTDGSVVYADLKNSGGTALTGTLIKDGVASIVNYPGSTDTAVVTVTVTPVNDAPVATDILNKFGMEGESFILNTSLNFTDVDGDVLTYSISTSDWASINPSTGIITGTPVANDIGVNVITVTATDPDGLSASTTLKVIVKDASSNITANNDTLVVVDEDTQSTAINVLSNDSDDDGDSLIVETATALNGTVVINADGTLTYTGNQDFNGSDTITYISTDGKGSYDTATVAVTVTPVNDAPTSVAITNDTATEDTAFSLNVSDKFTDVDGDALTYTISTSTWASIDASTGVITGTPLNADGGINTITVTATDPDGLATSQVFDVVVSNVNDAPIAVNDTAIIVLEDTASANINVLGNDTDEEGDSLGVVYATAKNGSVTINADGTLSYIGGLDFNGSDTITYTVSDGNDNFDTATVDVTVAAVNDAPETIDQAINKVGTEGVVFNLDISSNFSDIEGDTLTYSITASDWAVIDASTGVITGTPLNADTGVNTITITATDPGGLSDLAILNIYIKNVNSSVVANNDVAVTVNEDEILDNIDILGNDTDGDGDALSVSYAFVENGRVNINADGTLKYTPATNWVGSDIITYVVSDGMGSTDTATIEIVVLPVNDAPIASHITDMETAQDSIFTLNVSDKFTDVDGDVLTYSITASDWAVIDASTGVITGTPLNADTGVNTITVTATDPGGLSDFATFNIFVSNINSNVVAVDDMTIVIDEDMQSSPIDVLSNDYDADGDAVTLVSARSEFGTVVINADGTLSYTGDSNYFGFDTITYVITDGNGSYDSAIVDVVVTPINDAPIVENIESIITNENEDLSYNVGLYFNDVDGDTLTYTVSGPDWVSIDSNTGILSGIPFNDDVGVNSIFITATDPDGLTVVGSVDIFVSNINSNVVAYDDTAIVVDEDVTSTPINVLGNDTDPDGDVLSVSFALASNGTVVINADGTLSYTGYKDFNGSDTITYFVSDGNGSYDSAIVDVTVTPVDDPNYNIFTIIDESEKLGDATITFNLNNVLRSGDSDGYKAERDIDNGKIMIQKDLSFESININTGSEQSAYNFDIDIQDVVVTLKHIGGVSPLDSFGVSAADLNLDGDVSIFDVVPTLKHMIGVNLIDSFGFIDQNGAAVESLTNGTEMQKLFIVAKGDVDGSGDWNAGYSELV